MEPCVLCGGLIVGYGNNPAPIKIEGRCCDECNATFVVPLRFARLAKKTA